MGYRIESALNLVALVPIVNSAISDGWAPNGAPFYNSESRAWCQSMTRQDAHGTQDDYSALAGVVRLREKPRK